MAQIPTLKPRIPTLDTRIAPPPLPREKVADPFYSSKEWIALRDRVRAEAGGMCQRVGCSTPGRIVDHIVERSDGGASLDRANLELLCASHHAIKTNEAKRRRIASPGPAASNHPEWLKPSRVPLSVICGPPAGGKSTLAKQWLQGSGLLIDLDEIIAHLSKRPIYAAGKEWLNAAMRHRNSLLGQLSFPRPRWRRAALIVGEPTAERRQWWADKLRPHQVVVCETPEAVCLSRIDADPRRRVRAQDMSLAVTTWWNKYSPRAADVVIRP